MSEVHGTYTASDIAAAQAATAANAQRFEERTTADAVRYLMSIARGYNRAARLSAAAWRAVFAACAERAEEVTGG